MDIERYNLEEIELDKKIIYNFKFNINNALENNNDIMVINNVIAFNNFLLCMRNLEKNKLVIGNKNG
jgi:hypothetical protein